MKLLLASETDLSAALGRLSEKLAITRGITSSDSTEKTVAVFGEPLLPQEAVRRILRDVRERGDDAVTDYTRKLDGLDLTPDGFKVSQEEIAAACEAVPQKLLDSLRKATDNIRRFQEHIKIRPPEPLENAEGATLNVRYLPLRRVGIYAPGGRAAYPSTVLMTAVPAQVAGVDEIALATPCGPDGQCRRETLAAANVAGLKEVFRIGGAQAIAALAYGTKTIPRVDKIVGPGNIFVTLAKREVFGEVDLDMLAGPSEILIIADGSANPRFLAADLLSQAEHDPAASVLLTPDEAVAQATMEELERQLPNLPRSKAARECIERYGFIGVTRDLDEAIGLANRFAPEHLELVVEDADELLPSLRNAGTVFIGPYTPEAVGDYVAGPSHVLPTGGTARFFAGLSVNDFLRRTTTIECSEQALRRSIADIENIARAEGLDAHARSATIRFEE